MVAFRCCIIRPSTCVTKKTLLWKATRWWATAELGLLCQKREISSDENDSWRKWCRLQYSVYCSVRTQVFCSNLVSSFHIVWNNVGYIRLGFVDDYNASLINVVIIKSKHVFSNDPGCFVRRVREFPSMLRLRRWPISWQTRCHLRLPWSTNTIMRSVGKARQKWNT